MDINQISFSITGNAGGASRSITTLISKLNTLDASFVKAEKSGRSFISMLGGIQSSLGNATLNSHAYSSSLSGVAKSLTSVSSASKSVKLPTATMRTASSATKTASINTKSLGNSFASLSEKTTHSEHTLGRWLRRISQLSVAIILTRKAFQTLIGGIQSSISYTENLNLFTVALGENAQRASGFIKEMSESFYLDTASLTRTQGLFYQISNSLGLTSEKAYTLSENFTKMAYDLASFYNITVDEAVVKLQAGLVGETEPLRRIGIIITENNLAETARTLGIKKSIRNMTEQEKIQLRYVTALQQTKNAQGDLARTMLQPENMLRILREQFQILTRNLGNAFIPMLLKVIPHVIAMTSALADLAETFALSLGFKNTEILNSTASAAQDLADSNEDTAKSTGTIVKNLAKILKFTRDIKSMTTGIDELNILDQTTQTPSFSSMFGTTTTATPSSSLIDIGMPDYENNMSKAVGTFDELKDHYLAMFTEWRDSLVEIFRTTREALGDLFDTFDKIAGSADDNGVTRALKIINEILTGIINGVNTTITVFSTLFSDILLPIGRLIAPNWFNSILDGSLAGAVEKVFGIFVAYKVFASITKIGIALFKSYTILRNISTLLMAHPVLLGATTAMNLALQVVSASVTGDWEGLKDKILQALIVGLGAVALGASTGGATLAFNVAMLLNIDFTKVKASIGEKIYETLNNTLIYYIEDRLNLIIDYANLILKTVNKILPKSLEAKLLPHIVLYENIRDALNGDTSTDKATTVATQNVVSEAITAKDDKIGWKEKLGSWWDDKVGSLFKNKELDEVDVESISTVTADEVSIKADTVNTDNPALSGSWKDLAETVDKFSQVDSENFKGVEVKSKKYVMGVPQYATGGVPKKGNLFVAGEKGAELVTEHNGETVVMNEKQLAERGISLFADGVNVPKASYQYAMAYQKKSKSDNVADVIDKPLTFIVKTLKTMAVRIKDSSVGGTMSWVVKLVKDGLSTVVNYGKTLWDGLKQSKSFGWLITSVEKVASVMGKGLLVATTALFDTFNANKSLFMYGSNQDKQNLALDTLGGVLDGTTAGLILSIMQHIESGAVTDFLSSLPEMIHQGVEALKGLLLGVMDAMPEIMAMLPEVITSIVGFLTDSDTINAMVEAAIEIVNALVIALPDILQALIDAVPTILNALIHAVIENFPMFLKLGWNIGVAIFEGMAKIIASGLDLLISPIRGIMRLFHLEVPRLSSYVDFSGMYMADGGYPTTGQMFIAREAGAELVGNIGGRTGVANNDQIVEAVSAGVYKAVSAAMAQQTQKEVVVNLDGRKISDNQRKVTTARGLSFGMGGF